MLYVTWKAVGDFQAEGSPTTGDELYAGLYKRTLGVDRLWVRQDEAAALTRGEFPQSLRNRMLPHISNVVAGDATAMPWKLRNGQLTGDFFTDAGDFGDVLGFVETSDGRVTRCDLLVKGLGEQVIDCGFSASLTVIPKGKKVPVAVLFTLADPADGLAHVLPARVESEDYLK